MSLRMKLMEAVRDCRSGLNFVEEAEADQAPAVIERLVKEARAAAASGRCCVRLAVRKGLDGPAKEALSAWAASESLGLHVSGIVPKGGGTTLVLSWPDPA